VDTPAPKYDPAAARRLLAEAGYPQGIKIPLICSNRPAIRSQVGVAVKQMAQPAGFDIDVQTIPHDTYLANVWRKGNFYIGYWGMQPTEDAAFTLLFTTDAAFADTAWNNKEFDDLVARGRATLDDAERRRLYTQAQQLMVRDRPGVIADVTAALRDQSVSLESMLQRGRSPDEGVPVVLTTHETEEASMRRALARIEALDTVLEAPRLVRIETP